MNVLLYLSTICTVFCLCFLAFVLTKNVACAKMTITKFAHLQFVIWILCFKSLPCDYILTEMTQSHCAVQPRYTAVVFFEHNRSSSLLKALRFSMMITSGKSEERRTKAVEESMGSKLVEHTEHNSPSPFPTYPWGTLCT